MVEYAFKSGATRVAQKGQKLCLRVIGLLNKHGNGFFSA